LRLWKKEGTNLRRNKKDKGNTMLHTLQLLRFVKGTSQDEAMRVSEEIKPVASAISKLHLSEGISQIVK